jgi:hypothetical protein
MTMSNLPTRIVALLEAAASRATDEAKRGTSAAEHNGQPVVCRTPEAAAAERMAAFFGSLAAEARQIAGVAS